ncbi:hypothetical protein GCK32_015753 [Trichostrongylus colubriformis]|uniref:Lin-15A/B-like domain-containing protein n=1 Tax=Trichostrongylus colubriformis TaxID=6319 RepID=A0AAN8IE94_TRICO
MRTCMICGKFVSNEDTRPVSRTKAYNYIMLMSLSLSGQINIEGARTAAERITGMSRICAMHIVHAAQYLLAEMAVKGRTILCYDIDGVRTAYVNIGDIPGELVSALNRCAEDSGQTYVTARDVGKFINGALQRFYSTSFWPSSEEERISEDVFHVDRDAEVSNGDVKLFGDETHQHSADNSRGLSLERNDEPECITLSSCSSEQSLRETGVAALDQYYLVQGKLLVQLFKFCPKCGHRLNGTELSNVGTAAIVKFVCNTCSTVQQWASQERTVAYNKKRTYKGNMDAAVAAVTTGLRYVELRQWAKKLNLALFSKDFFTKFVK